MALATTCPQCKTSFKVVPDQLKLRRGLVRCGVCQHVFSGIDYLRYVDDASRAAAAAAARGERAAGGDADAWPAAGGIARPAASPAPARPRRRRRAAGRAGATFRGNAPRGGRPDLGRRRAPAGAGRPARRSVDRGGRRGARAFAAGRPARADDRRPHTAIDPDADLKTAFFLPDSGIGPAIADPPAPPRVPIYRSGLDPAAPGAAGPFGVAPAAGVPPSRPAGPGPRRGRRGRPHRR
jgi:predicted Zn finger-like uncharacterized protein